MLTSRSMEPLENVENKRYSIFPIKFPSEYLMYEKARAAFWVPDEVRLELAKDLKDWVILDPKIKQFIEHILAFFVVSDGLVNENLTEELLSRIQIREVRLVLDFQVMIEDIHNIVYGMIIDEYKKDPIEKQRLFNAIENFPTIQNKIRWVNKWLGKTRALSHLPDDTRTILNKLETLYRAAENTSNTLFPNSTLNVNRQIDRFFTDVHEQRPSLARQILINTIMEGLFFSGSFCAIFWVFTQYDKLPGLAKANEYISRDEGFHTMFGIHLYKNRIKNKLPQHEVHQLITEAVEVESAFIRAALPSGLLGMNSDLMTQYIQFVANQLLVALGYESLFEASNPFPFMNKQSISVRMSDFFVDQSVSEYSVPSSSGILDFSEDF